MCTPVPVAWESTIGPAGLACRGAAHSSELPGRARPPRPVPLRSSCFDVSAVPRPHTGPPYERGCVPAVKRGTFGGRSRNCHTSGRCDRRRPTAFHTPGTRTDARSPPTSVDRAVYCEAPSFTRVRDTLPWQFISTGPVSNQPQVRQSDPVPSVHSSPTGTIRLVCRRSASSTPAR